MAFSIKDTLKADAKSLGVKKAILSSTQWQIFLQKAVPGSWLKASVWRSELGIIRSPTLANWTSRVFCDKWKAYSQDQTQAQLEEGRILFQEQVLVTWYLLLFHPPPWPSVHTRGSMGKERACFLDSSALSSGMLTTVQQSVLLKGSGER